MQDAHLANLRCFGGVNNTHKNQHHNAKQPEICLQGAATPKHYLPHALLAACEATAQYLIMLGLQTATLRNGNYDLLV